MTRDRGRPACKICGVTSVADADLAVRLGASHLGANLVPGSPRIVDLERAREIGEAVDVPLALVVADRTAGQLIRDLHETGATVVQLHGAEGPELIQELRAAGSWEIWKAVRPRSGDELLEAVARFEGAVDLLLVDAWHPERLGGTGSRADWSEIGRVRDRIPDTVRLGLAGGLDPSNVEDAIRIVRPDLVDVASGVESSPGRKDAGLLEAFAKAVRGGVSAPESGSKHDRGE